MSGMTKEIRSFLFHSRVQLNFEKLILLGFIRIVLGIIAALFVLGIIAALFVLGIIAVSYFISSLVFKCEVTTFEKYAVRML